MNLSVVLVTYDSEDCIEGALASVRRHLPRAELVVVDNASRDRTRALVRGFGQVRLVEQEENLGFGRACNVGADHSSGAHLLFLNPDARIASVDGEALESLWDERPFGLVSPHYVSDAGAAQNGHDGLRPERHWFFAYASQTFALVRPKELPRGLPRPRPGQETWLAASALLVEREEFDRLGRFDPRFFLYYEDRELSARYRDGGMPIRSTPTIRAEHRGGASSRTHDIRTAAHGWELLGWIQYLSLRNGPRVARRAGRLAIGTLRSLHVGLRISGVFRVERLERKRRQVGQLLDFIDDAGENRPGSGREFCPDAFRHLARRSRVPRAYGRPKGTS